MLIQLPTVTLNLIRGEPGTLGGNFTESNENATRAGLLTGQVLLRGTYSLKGNARPHPLAEIKVGRRSVSLPFVQILLSTFDQMEIPDVHKQGLTLWLTRRPWIGKDAVSDRGRAKYSMNRRRIALRTDETQTKYEDAPPLWRLVWDHFPESAHRLGANHVRSRARSLIHERGHDVQIDLLCKVNPQPDLSLIQQAWVLGIKTLFAELITMKPQNRFRLLQELDQLVAEPMRGFSVRKGATYVGYASSFVEVGAEHFCLYTLERLLAKRGIGPLTYSDLVCGGVDQNRVRAMSAFGRMYEITKARVFADDRFEWLLKRRNAME